MTDSELDFVWLISMIAAVVVIAITVDIVVTRAFRSRRHLAVLVVSLAAFIGAVFFLVTGI